MTTLTRPPVRPAPPARPEPTLETPRRSVRQALARMPLAATMLVAGSGLLLQCLGYYLGWTRDPQDEVHVLVSSMPVASFTLWTYYLGLTLIISPFLVLLTSSEATRRTRVWGSLAYAQTLYLSWMLLNPLMGTHIDETLQSATLRGLLAGGEFFKPNEMLPVSPFYPGLALTASGLHWLTGLPVMVCQVLTVVLARSLLVLALYGIFARVTGSHRAASIGILLYATNPQFYFFDAQYNYDTLAVALAALTMRSAFLLRDEKAGRLAWAGALAALSVLVITHHLGSWITLLALWAWGGLHLISRDRRQARVILTLAATGTGMVVAWTLLAKQLLVVYLGPLFRLSYEQLSGIIEGQSAGRELMANTAGAAPPLWQQLNLLASAALWCLLLVAPAWLVLRGRLLRGSSARWLPWVIACAYPPMLLLRVSPNAGEVSVRASGYVMMATSLLVAAWLASRLPRDHMLDVRRRLVLPAVVAGGLCMTIGGIQLGAGGAWEHQTGPFLGSAQHRAVDADTLAAARWSAAHMPPGSRIAADTTMNRIIPMFSDIEPVTYLNGNTNVTGLFVDESLEPTGMSIVLDGEVDFVVVDTRLAAAPSLNGSFYEPSATYGTTDTVTATALAKFEGAPGFLKVLDEGPVKIYDVRSLRGEPGTFIDSTPPLLPGPGTWWQALLTLELALLGLLGLFYLGRRRAMSPEWLTDRGTPALALGMVGLMALAGLGFLDGFTPLHGALVLGEVVLVVLAVARLRRRPLSVPVHPSGPAISSTSVATSSLVVVVYVVAIGLAALGAWQGMVEPAADLLPPPVIQAGQ
jgi:hypothetical protein